MSPESVKFPMRKQGRPMKKPRARFDDDETYVPTMPTGARRASLAAVLRPKRPRQGGSPNQKFSESPSGVDDLLVPEEHTMLSDHSWSPTSKSPSEDGTIRACNVQRGAPIKQYRRRKCDVTNPPGPTETNDLVAAINAGGSPLSQLLPRAAPRPHEDVSSHEARKPSTRENLSSIAAYLRAGLRQLELHVEDEEARDEITNLELQADEAREAFFQSNMKERRLERECLGLNSQLDEAEIAAHQLKLRVSTYQTQLMEKERENQLLKKQVEELTKALRHQKSSRPQHRRHGLRRLSNLMPGSQSETGLGDEQQLTDRAGLCGSYTDESANPNALLNALCNAKLEVTSFQKTAFRGVVPRQDEAGREALIKDVLFARPHHVGYYFKAAVYEVFFKGFENESFNTSFGVSRFLDPGRRQANFYEYYLRQRDLRIGDTIEDLEFEEYCEAKASDLLETFPECCGKRLEDLGGPQLAQGFRAAAKSVWLLHKVAFSFEPPASIFRVGRGGELDRTYMETVVQVEDNDRFTPRVGFMICPGLRLRTIVLRCEVYLAVGVTTGAHTAPQAVQFQ